MNTDAWPDLPAVTFSAVKRNFWGRPRRWGSPTAGYYERTALTRIYVNEQTHNVLRETLRSCAALQRQTYAYLAREGCGSKARNEWRAAVSKAFDAAGVAEGRSLARVARERAVARAVSAAAAMAAKRKAIEPWWAAECDLPGGLTFRVNAGVAYEAPVRFEYAGLWLGPEVGFVKAGRVEPNVVKRLGEAAYAEIGHEAGIWHVRFVFFSATKAEASERKPRERGAPAAVVDVKI